MQDRELGRPPGDIWDTTGYGQQAVSTHPSGMHSSCKMMALSPMKCEESLNQSDWLDTPPLLGNLDLPLVIKEDNRQLNYMVATP